MWGAETTLLRERDVVGPPCVLALRRVDQIRTPAFTEFEHLARAHWPSCLLSGETVSRSSFRVLQLARQTLL